MAVLARNKIKRPKLVGTSPSDVWTDPAGVPASVGGRDSWNNVIAGVHVQSNTATTPVTDVDGLTAGATVHIWAGSVMNRNNHEMAFELITDTGQAYNPSGPASFSYVSSGGYGVQDIHGTVTVPEPGGDMFLRVHVVNGADTLGLQSIRLSEQDEPDDLGIFDGDTLDPAGELPYSWTGEPYESESIAGTVAPDPEPDPDPDPEPVPEPTDLAANVAAFLGRPGDVETIALATVHVGIVTGYVYGYTRGRGFTESGVPKPDLSGVITAATARLTSNPEQVSYYATGDYSERPAVLAGWTLPELAVLHRYRRRYA